MNYLRKTENKLSETAVYRYTVGFLFKAAEILKKGILLFISRITEFSTAISIIGIATAANTLDGNKVNYTSAILFITIFAVLITQLIKIKVLENKVNKKAEEKRSNTY